MKLKKILSLFTIVALLFAGLLATPAFADENSWQATYPDLQTFSGILQYPSSITLPGETTKLWAHFDRGQVIYGFSWDVTSSDQEWKQTTQTDRYGDDWQTANELDYQQAPSNSVVPGWQNGLQFQNDPNYAGPYSGQEPRYMGYDVGMNEVSNENFPIDTSGLIPPAQCVMIEQPWNSVSGDPNYTKGSGWPSGPNSPTSAVPDYTWGIIERALQNCYKTQFGFTAEADSFVNNPAFSAQNGGLSPTNIENYFELLTMPEPGITGSVRFWHNINGSPYYKTIEIPYTSLLPVYYAQSIDPFSGSPGVTTAQDNGTQYTGTVTFGVKPETIDSSNSDQTDVQLANLINLSLTASDILSAPVAVCVNSEDNYAAISTTDTTPYQPVSAVENCGGPGEGITLGSLTQGGVAPGAYTATFTWSVPSDFTGTSMPIGAGINDGYNDWDNATTDIIPDDITTNCADISEEYMIDDYTHVNVPVTGAPSGTSGSGTTGSGGTGSNGNTGGGTTNTGGTTTNGSYTGELQMVAVNQTTWSTTPMVTQQGQQAKKVTRATNTAEWTDQITATLNPAAPDGASYVPDGAIYDSDTWSVQSATITYPLKNPAFAVGNPVDPAAGATTSQDMTPSGQTATAQFLEEWSLDGFGVGVYDVLTNEVIAQNPSNWQITADYTLSCTVQYHYMITNPDGSESPGPEQSLTVNPTGTATQTLTVDGAGAMPSTSGNTRIIVSTN